MLRTELAIGLNVMNGTLAGSAALLVAAGALTVLTPVLVILGNMSWEAIAKGLITVAGAFTIMGRHFSESSTHSHKTLCNL